MRRILTRKLSFALCAATVAGMAAMVTAGPLNKSVVAADAKWVVHVDMEAATRTTLGSRMMAGGVRIPALEEFKSKTGVDLVRDVKEVTAFGTVLDSDDGVIVVRGTGNLEGAFDQFMGKEKSVQKEEAGAKELYSWKEGAHQRFASILRGKGEADRRLVVGGGRDVVMRALELIDGHKANMTEVKEGALAKSPAPGSVVFVAITGIDSAAQSIGPKVLRTAKDLVADAGEDENGAYGTLTLRTASAEDGRNVADFVKGMIAMGKMAAQGEKEMKAFGGLVDGISVEAFGDGLTARLSIPRPRVVEVVDEIVNTMKGQKEEHKR